MSLGLFKLTSIFIFATCVSGLAMAQDSDSSSSGMWKKSAPAKQHQQQQPQQAPAGSGMWTSSAPLSAPSAAQPSGQSGSGLWKTGAQPSAPSAQSSGAMWKSGAQSSDSAQANGLWNSSGNGVAQGGASQSGLWNSRPNSSAQPASGGGLWGSPQQTPLEDSAPSQAAPMTPVEQQQQSLEAQTCVDCANAKKETQVDKLARIGNDYAEMASRSLVSRGVQQVMNVTYQRCDADNDSMLVPPTYYNPAFHNDDSGDQHDKDGHYNGKGMNAVYYKGSSAFNPANGDMWSGNSDDVNHHEYFDYKTASAPGGMFYTKSQYAPGCMDMSKKPPVFCDGGRSQFTTLGSGQAYVNVFNSGARTDKSGKPATCSSANFTTFDCSDLVSAVFIASGLRFYKTGPAAMPVTTATMAHFSHPGPNDCMGPAQFSGPKSIESGDVVVFNSHHSLVIDSVGADPFGLQKMQPGQDCRDMDPANFDIKIVQAGVFGGRMGPSRLRYQDLLTTNGALDPTKAALMQFAIKACESARSGTASKAVVSVNEGGDDYGATILRPIGLRDPKCYVHKPATHPDCKNPAAYACHQPWGAKMKGEECLNSCSFDDSAEGSAQ